MAAKPVEYNATIIHKKLHTPTLGVFRVRPDEPIGGFIPGQYAILGLNHSEKGGVMRAYSIASPPCVHEDYYEFYVRYVNQPTSTNPLTHLLFEAEEGDRILMRKRIQGHFTVEKTMGLDDPRMRVLVASGTGLAPFTSMVFEWHHQLGHTRNSAIVHGASYPTDLGYREELEEVMNRGEQQRYLPTISRPKEVPGWDGLTGRVENHFAPESIGVLEERLGLGEGGFNPRNCTVMICGLQGTIANTLTSLLYRGFVPGDRKLRRVFGIPKDLEASLFFEQYDTTPIIDTKDEALVSELVERLRAAGVPAGEDAAAAR